MTLEEKIKGLRRVLRALRLEVPGDIMDNVDKIAEAVMIEAAEWKRRAAAHGCDTEKGDPDCG